METYDLQMKPGGVPLIIHTSQFDTDREYTFVPYYGSEKYAYQSGSTCVTEGTKADGYVVIEKPTYNSDGTIYYKPSAELTNAAGDAHIKIRIVSSASLTIASARITFAVDKAGIQPEAKLSASDIEILEQDISQLNAKVSAAAVSAQNAANSASAAKTSQTAAATSATNAKSSQTAAATSATNAKTSETNAASSKTAAATSATNAKTSETNAASSKTAAATSATNAKTSETNAASSKTAAATSATNAKTSETNAASSKTAAATSATQAKSWAVGPSGTGTSGTDTNNAKYWAERAKATAAGAFTYQGSCTYANLPTSKATGDVWNVEDSFTLDSHSYPAGTNVVWNGSSWDPLGGILDTDTTPTQNSTKVVTSGGIWTAFSTWAAAKLATARTIKVNLASTSAASFNGTANVTPGVSGVLPITYGGTGASTAANALSKLGAAAASDVSKKLSTQSLTASGGTLTWTDSSISSTAIIDVYATIPLISPSAMSVSGTTLSVTFDAQDEAFDVLVTVRS